MPDSSKVPPPIIVKKSKKHGGHHGGAWKVAYADFVTAMMAFFLVMWIVVQSEEIKQSVAGYFNDPIGFSKGAKTSVLKGAGPAVIPPKNLSEMDRKRAEEVMKKELMMAAERIRVRLAELPEFESLKDKIEITMTSEGLRIQLIESSADPDSTFYRLGSRHLNARGKEILTAIAQELKKLNNQIVIEGHTDSRPYVYDRVYSNWELSTDRANSARKLMVEGGVSRDRMEAVRGYADNHLRIPESPYDPRNRRICIIVLNDYSELRYKELQEKDWALKPERDRRSSPSD